MMVILAVMGRITCVICVFFWYYLYSVPSHFFFLLWISGIMVGWVLLVEQWWCDNFVVAILWVSYFWSECCSLGVFLGDISLGNIWINLVTQDNSQDITCPRRCGISVLTIIKIWFVFMKKDEYFTVFFPTYVLVCPSILHRHNPSRYWFLEEHYIEPKF